MLAHELPDIHFRLHLEHLYSPKQRFLPWYGVLPMFFLRAWKDNARNEIQFHRNDTDCFYLRRWQQIRSQNILFAFVEMRITTKANNVYTIPLKIQPKSASPAKIRSTKASDNVFRIQWKQFHSTMNCWPRIRRNHKFAFKSVYLQRGNPLSNGLCGSKHDTNIP